MELVTIIIPIYKAIPDSDEKISFRQCVHVLSGYPINIVTHPDLDISYYESMLRDAQLPYSVQYFDKAFFENIEGYNKLLLKPDFYTRFTNYRYILIYQLDAFVFTNKLEQWCNKGYSYIGAPWITATSGEFAFNGVGNGGFSLRNVADHIKALHSFSYIESPRSVFYKYFLIKHPLRVYLHLIWRFIKQLTVLNNTYYRFNNYDSNEDYFWCKVIAANFNWFTVPAPEEAMKFSMEHHPEYLYRLNHNQLPFGCHAWTKHDFAFWKPFIEYPDAL
ncbi:MAG: DUF5672 family protein [Bacteroidota bacterium]